MYPPKLFYNTKHRRVLQRSFVKTTIQEIPT